MWWPDDAGGVGTEYIRADLSAPQAEIDAVRSENIRLKAAFREVADKIGNLYGGFTYRPRDMRRHILKMIDQAEGAA